MLASIAALVVSRVILISQGTRLLDASGEVAARCFHVAKKTIGFANHYSALDTLPGPGLKWKEGPPSVVYQDLCFDANVVEYF